jgi:hypothetical protein
MKMIVVANPQAPKNISEALELAAETSGALQVPPERMCLTLEGGLIEEDNDGR